MKLAGIYTTFLISFLFLNVNVAQSIDLKRIEPSKSSPLHQLFSDFKLLQISYDQLKAAASSRGNRHYLHLKSDGLDWNLEMFGHDIYTSDYLLRVAGEDGIKDYRRKPAIQSMIGYLRSTRGGEARLTIADQFIAGMVEQGGVSFFIEPANAYDPALGPDYLVVYDGEKVYHNPNIECGYELYMKNKEHFLEESREMDIHQRSHCLQVEIALANDFPVFQKRGSVVNVENWNNTILTLMQANYDNEFQHSLEFVQSASFVATSASGDPWNGVNNINAHLDRHVSWANGGGYGNTYDVATAWTTKYTNGAVGLAWLGVVCNNLRYNVCSDFGASNNSIRQLQAHELGHNFNADHDPAGSPTIMAPSVNGSSTWSTNSVNRINAHVNSRGCLSICSSGTPPSADFAASPTDGCVPFNVQFTDLSTNDPTTWQWTFPGGTPSSSNQRNPSVQYRNRGAFDVTLRVTNPYGSDQITFTRYIQANDKPIANFSKVIIERTVYLTNTSQYGTSYEWDFGDGETSMDVDPIHEYADDGVYEITLRVLNDCGIHETKMSVTIVTIPVALFVADTTKGCATMKVKFINLSTKNVTRWEWEFPGGTPSVSNLFEPVVEYKNPGVFDVKLTARNSKYKSIAERKMYIQADSIPVSAFDYTINGLVVDFLNQSRYANAFQWDFGDGNTSSENNPKHQFRPGSYLVKLLVNNRCGVDTFARTIVIGSGLSVGFTANQTEGCTPFSVKYSNTSTGANAYLWTFPGGTPSSSTQAEPTVTYDTPGSYDVNLKVYGASDTLELNKPALIRVQSFPEAGFTSAVTGSTVFFTSQSQFASSYSWDFGDNQLSTDPSPSHDYAAEGEYTVRLIVSNICGLDTMETKIAVYLIPKVDFTADTTILCGSGVVRFKSKSSSDVQSWSWQFEGGRPEVSDLKDPSVEYDRKGNYTVKLIVKNTNGENVLIRQSFIKVLSPVLCPDHYYTYTDELDGDLDFPLAGQAKSNSMIYPNPFSGHLMVSGSTTSGQITIEVLNLLGSLVHQEKLEQIVKSYSHSIDLNHLDAGSYLVRIQDGTQTLTRVVFLSK